MAARPAGGPANINGVLYQMLWSLLRTAKLYISGCVADESRAIQKAILKLEPIGGGGDQQELAEGKIVVQQLKAKYDEGTWSLRSIVEGVLPDLYKAVDPSAAAVEYQFVTEGNMGQWNEAYTFFSSLGKRPCPSTAILEALDDVNEVRFRRQGRQTTDDATDNNLTASWGQGSFTERSLFELIVAEIRQRVPAAGQEPIQDTQRNLWHLLGAFRFIGGWAQDLVRQEVDILLLSLVDTDDALDGKRDAMLTGLARRAAQGDAEIVPAEFLADYQLDSVPLIEWGKLRQRATDCLERRLNLCGYLPNEDARKELAESVLRDWPDDKSILILSGESGQGKSWLTYGVASVASKRKELTILIIAEGQANQDIQSAADAFWQDIKNNDGHLALNRIAERRRKLVHDRAGRWLTLLIDGIQDTKEAKDLALKPWEDWGVRIVAACSPSAASVFRQVAADRCHEVSVPDFTSKELHDYLATTVGEGWADIPSDVRATLGRPLLARLCRDLAKGKEWRPKNEYELYAKYWARLFEGEQAEYELDAVGLKRLARSLLCDTTYPWTGEQLEKEGLGNEAVTRLSRIGWLRSVGKGRFEIWHDRLLNWAVAEAMVAAFQAGEMAPEWLITQAVDLLSGQNTYGGRHLGYVPMDIVWLLADPGVGADDVLEKLIAAYESGPWSIPRNLYTLLQTVGPRIVPVLFRRLEAVVTSGDIIISGEAVTAIASFDEPEVVQRAVRLLEHESYLVRRAAMRILAKRPSPDALDRLWELHCEATRAPASFLGRDDREYQVYEDTFGALRSCASVNPDWLRQAVENANSENEPVHTLAYLVANTANGKGLWLESKPILFEKVPPGHERSLASNIFAHADDAEVDWLLKRVDRTDNLLGPWALRALIRLDPDKALAELGRLPKEYLGPTKHWCFGELLAKRPELTRSKILSMMKEHAAPWTIAQVYRDDENSMDATTLEFLLDDLQSLLDTALAHPSGSTSGPLYTALTILSKADRLELTECFERRRDALLEETLTQWMTGIGPRVSVFPDCLERDPAMSVLHRIGGEGFTKVMNSWLRANNQYGRWEGIQLAAKRPDNETIDLLYGIAQRDSLWNGGDYPVEQSHSADALAALGHRDKVIAYLLRWHLRVSPETLQYCTTGDPMCDESMSVGLHALTAEAVPSPGAVLALAVGGRKDYVPKVRAILEQVPPDSDTALACVLTLDHLGDRTAATEAVLIRQLEVKKHRSAATRALVHTRSESAINALLKQLEREYDDTIADALRRHPGTQVRAAELIWERFRSPAGHFMVGFMTDSFGLLETQDANEYLRATAFDNEGGFWIGGTKIRAIRGLARFDPDSAFLAARRALANTAYHEREQYPYLLIELNRERAIHALLSQIVQERSTAVSWAIGRALSDGYLTDELKSWLMSPETRQRLAACRLAGWMKDGGVLEKDLRSRLDDPNEEVAQAAREALVRLRDGREALSLVAVISEERDTARRWVLLDCLVRIADPGDDNQPLPPWGEGVWQCLSPIMRKHLCDGVKKRRKEMAATAKRRDQ